MNNEIARRVHYREVLGGRLVSAATSSPCFFNLKLQDPFTLASVVLTAKIAKKRKDFLVHTFQRGNAYRHLIWNEELVVHSKYLNLLDCDPQAKEAML